MIASQLTDQALKELKDLFLSMDDNNDGTLSVGELKEGLARQGVALPPDLAEMMDETSARPLNRLSSEKLAAACLVRMVSIPSENEGVLRLGSIGVLQTGPEKSNKVWNWDPGVLARCSPVSRAYSKGDVALDARPACGSMPASLARYERVARGHASPRHPITQHHRVSANLRRLSLWVRELRTKGLCALDVEVSELRIFECSFVG